MRVHEKNTVGAPIRPRGDRRDIAFTNPSSAVTTSDQRDTECGERNVLRSFFTCVTDRRGDCIVARLVGFYDQSLRCSQVSAEATRGNTRATLRPVERGFHWNVEVARGGTGRKREVAEEPRISAGRNKAESGPATSSGENGRKNGVAMALKTSFPLSGTFLS
jgi:hypothetical protein